jgi:hypothetical protein
LLRPPDASAGRPELGQKKLKELKKAGHPVDRLHASFDKCWADAREHAAERDTRYDARVEVDDRQPGRPDRLDQDNLDGEERGTPTFYSR